jgi:hypothetical protein
MLLERELMCDLDVLRSRGLCGVVFLALWLEFASLLFSDEILGIFNHSSNFRVWSDQLSTIICTRPTLDLVFSCATCDLQGDPVSQPHEVHVPSLSRVGLQPYTHKFLVYASTYSSKLAHSFYCWALWLLEWYTVVGMCFIHLVWWTQTDSMVTHQVEHRTCWVHVCTFEGPSLW